MWLQLTLCKDASGKVGVRVQAISKGVFVSLVMKGSPAALAGLRFGDQILQINGANVAGFSMEQVHSLFRKSPVNGISVVVRDRFVFAEYRIYSRNSRTFLTKILYLNLGCVIYVRKRFYVNKSGYTGNFLNIVLKAWVTRWRELRE